MSPYPDHDSEFSGAGFANALRTRRRAAGLTQEELAAKAGVGVRTLRDLERGRVNRPQRGTVALLADALELSGDAREKFIGAASTRRTPSVDPATSRLPSLPELFGRDRDIDELLVLLATNDLVTLVGLAGVGKTSLALAVGHRVAARAHGADVAAVAVTDVSGPGDILAAVAAAFDAGRAIDLAVDGLLVLDGVDRSPHAAAEAIERLRARTPALKILATSRQPGISPVGIDWRVEPLEVPPPGDGVVRTYPAAALFLARLRLVRRSPVAEAEVPALAELVRRLGGLPLAIELAAARGRILEIPELLERYGDRVLDLGTTEPDGERLRDAVAASYRLLEPDEQAVLRRLSTFRGRWSLALAEALLADRPGINVESVLDRLVGFGLVSVRGPGDLRFRLLDVVGDFASEQCARTGERPFVRARHAEVIARVVTRIAAELTGRTLLTAVIRLDQLSSDIRSALRYASARDPHLAMRVATAIARWCRFRGRDREARMLLRQLLDDPRTADADSTLHAWAQVAVAMLARSTGYGYEELAATERALRTFVARRDTTGELAARGILCVLWRTIGDYDRVRRHADALLELATRTGRNRDTACAYRHLAKDDVRHGQLGVAVRRLATARLRAAEVGDDRLRALIQADLAEIARLDTRFGDAVELGRRAAASLADLGDPAQRVRVQGTVARSLAESGRLVEAQTVLAELPVDGPGAFGLRAMVGGYVALAADDRERAVASFTAAGELLAGWDDARDVVEALVGVLVSADDPEQREEARSALASACERSGMALLPRDRALLRRFRR